MHVGHRIKLLRTEKGISLPKLAEDAGLSKGLLYQIENSETPPNPSLDTLSKICKALTITLAVLLEKGGVKAKRVIPDRLAPELEEMIKLLKKQGELVNESALEALYVLQERSATTKTVQQWRFVYDSICLMFHQNK
jgi:transcriptional regulator with XRE-family HTH domain